MEQRLYQGGVTPEGMAEALLTAWDQDDTIAQGLGDGDRVVVQIGQRRPGLFSDEPRQALTLDIERVAEGVQVTMGQQRWIKDTNVQIFAGGLIGFLPFFFAFPLGHLFGSDETVDQNLPARIWQSLDQYVASLSPAAATGATTRLATVACPACGVANPLGAQQCSACGAALAVDLACPHCGRTNPPGARFCNQCGTPLASPAQPQGATGGNT
ncbi:MAG: zinc ribbon domain-containing protein [Herpetosiphonaceae bacterium]|nr:zinc ribbon domain-containing protein [Herpetosiphonaceae bacterium]